MLATFCGHGELRDRAGVEMWLQSVCEALIHEGVREFYLGGYGAFDHLAAATLRRLKITYPQIRFILILPYLNRGIPSDNYDETLYPPLEMIPKRLAIVRRNEWMVEQADIVVAHVIRGWGGASRTLQYAQRKQKRIIRYCQK